MPDFSLTPSSKRRIARFDMCLQTTAISIDDVRIAGVSMLLLLIILLQQPVRVQSQTRADTLRANVRQAANDTARIRALWKLARWYVFSEHEDSLAFHTSHEALRLADALAARHDPSASYFRALALSGLGYAEFRIGMKTFGEPHFATSMTEARRVNDTERSLRLQAFIL
jgi:hypothetical protein